jgi:predicted alpha/beta superfamily hydrolase
VLHGVKSPELLNSRDVRVYLPPGYAKGAHRYPVLYMHDGQNVFDEATAFVKQEWHADEAAEALAKAGRELIIVAVDNTADRGSEYAPFRAPMNDYQARGDRYLAFLIKTLKPMIDAKYRTRPDPAHTGLAGSSLGGLITLYGVLAHPAVFGFGAAFSPSLSSADFNLLRWARAKPTAKPLRLYLDMGDKEDDSNAWNQVLVESTEDLGKLLTAQGHETRVVIAHGAHHNEDAWAPRLPPVLEWFLADQAAPDAGVR